MAITQTGAMYKSLSFDNTSSRNYGVYITGEAVYNAPERAVEMISIPGRNGAFALDQGRFENIEVSYPAGIFADNEADFAQAVSDFRNFLCSKKGYCRLTDEYNPNEYRMAVYKSGLEVDPAQLRAGEFKITFDCKPQRWLTSGESKSTIAASGDTITNPTLFPSSPLLEVTGYGNIGLGGAKITVNNSTLGEVTVFDGYTSTSKKPTHLNIANLIVSQLNSGDAITMSNLTFEATYDYSNTYYAPRSCTVSATANVASYTASVVSTRVAKATLNIGPISFTYGTSSTSATSTATVDVVRYAVADGPSTPYTQTDSYSYSIYAIYNGTNQIDIYISGYSQSSLESAVATISTITGTSSKSTLVNPAYIDLDFGEAYGYVSGVLTSLNNSIVLPAELPTLESGSNSITFDNTITQLKITPRWWKV